MVHVIMGGRQSGKTSAIIDQLKQDPKGVLLTINEQEADRLRKLYKGQIEDWRIVSVNLWRQVKTKVLFPHVYIDNADLVLQGMLQSRVFMVSMTTSIGDKDG